ncbi:E3 ubiquitin- ligase NRDP1 [Paramuricea clavata]|uniref:E3 ubiquitin- ligase NRDP1 n=1 Tax=Paramuricea clavata TaxID=317549 RepID=A0A6S7JG45_PARCT|nr:E3 ubiquitin- ligase NRDP1 [Paramuricea clavata]
MACCPTEVKYGYEDCRFEKDVDENFHCSICYNVLKEPRTCRNNDHIFCLACITQHLKVNSQTCPECNEHLSVDTLRRPRVLSNYLSKLKINCDHASRGCPQFTCLEDLKTHVANCGYAPVLCSNAECGMEINKQDKVHHETEVCDYRKVTCHDCGQIQEDVGTLKGSLMELDGKVEAVKEINKEMNEKVKEINEKVEAVKEINGKVEAAVKQINEKVEASSGQTKKEIGEVKKEVKDMKDNLSKVNKDVDEVKVMMIQMLEKLNMLELLNKLPSPTEGMLNTPREDILIAGGYGGHSSSSGKSTEIYSWEKNGWVEVSPMNDDHKGASSFTHKDQFFVVGGGGRKAIETLNLDELPLKWTKFLGELPYKYFHDQTVVYQQSIIHIGGYEWIKGYSNVISELQLTSPCTMKELCQMPQPRGHHSAEVLEDKVLILGGFNSVKITNSVLEFDPKRNKCKEMPKLPSALRRMATVRWRDEVVVLGGCGKDDKVLNDVFMYNSKTGKTTALPSMLEKRCNCCAVITGNTIVVMGGRNEKDEYLSSVECFRMGGSTWEYLPAMNNPRYEAVADVLPSTRKYV